MLNAANEVAVARFLEGKMGFFAITEAVCSVVDEMQWAKERHTLEDIIACDRTARELIGKYLKCD